MTPEMTPLILLAALVAIAAIALVTAAPRPRPGGGGLVAAPPPDLSPAMAAYALARRYPKPALTAAVANLERQGFLRATGTGAADSPFAIKRTRRTDTPPLEDEAALYTALFADGPELTVAASDAAGRRRLKRARQAHERALRARFNATYHRGYPAVRWALLATAGAGAWMALFGGAGGRRFDGDDAIILFSGVGAFLLALFAGAQTRLLAPDGATPARPVVAVLPVVGMVGVMAALLINGHATPSILLVAAMAFIAGCGRAWLPRLTDEGQAAVDAAGGMRAYIETTTPPPEELAAGADAARGRFAALRPYATAMGVGPAWSAHNAALLAALGIAAFAATRGHERDHGEGGSGSTDSWSAFDDPGGFDGVLDSAFSDALDSASSDSGSSDGNNDSGGGDSDSGGDSGGGSDGGGE
ncbi:MAG: DUF2207 domain-containing protein [Rhodospirillales bacterium]|nr:MAG: DUF2207 domain-containing protein [Rhodospirillales bacterium]